MDFKNFDPQDLGSLFRKKEGRTNDKPFHAPPPRVSFLPPSAIERALDLKAAAQSKLIGGIGAATLLTLVGSAFLSANAATGTLEDKDTELAHANQQLTVFAPVERIGTETEMLTGTIDARTTSNVDHSVTLAMFIEGLGDSATVSSFNFTSGDQADGSTSETCGTTDPFNLKKLAGCISFTVDSHIKDDAAAKIIEQLSANPLLVDPLIGTQTSDSDALTGTVGVSDQLIVELNKQAEEKAAAEAKKKAAEKDAEPTTDAPTDTKDQ